MSVTALARRAQAAVASPRLRRRLLVVLAHSANSLLVPLLSPLVSALVVRLAGVALWGDFVAALLVAQLISHVAVWGNKDFVLRAASRQPEQLAAAWQTSLLTRLAVWAAGAAVLALFGFTPERWLGLAGLSLVLMLAQAFEVLVLYRRDFVFALAVESAVLLLLAGAIWLLRRALAVDALLTLFVLASLAKVALLGWRYRGAVLARRVGRFQPTWLGAAFPFFLLGFSGLLQSRVDLYLVAFWLPPPEIGRYQVYTNLMIYLQSASAFVLLPFAKGLYRIALPSLLGLSRRLPLLGLALVAGGLPAAALVLRHVYGLDFAPAFFAAGGLFVLPIFFYPPVIYALFRNDQPGVVVLVNLFGLALNLGLSLWWLPRWGALGAAWASAATQWALALVYWAVSRRLRREEAASASRAG